MASMLVFMVSGSLYVLALCIAATLLVPVPRKASRGARTLHAACGGCAAAAILAALAATLPGLWVLAGGFCGLAAVCSGVWLRLTLKAADAERDDGDDSDDDDGGGRVRRPVPPAPCTPPGDPPTDWAQFDRDRASWERPRVPAGV